ncbi:hypothetical protein B0A49_09162 [Cryomyces minteri]|uniref:NAD(P)-binding protein n=1 Tax=Cryomyces minteri TaxID=331657 RepID=A0A4U0WKI0_9PEZI|nr:hypothetical protein B0A49_09162 [Cryomyces minteri]
MPWFGESWNPVTDILDLTGKIALVTGRNAGIGSAIVEQLAIHGAKVYLGARSAEKAEDAIRKIETEHLEVREKKEFMKKESHLDMLGKRMNLMPILEATAASPNSDVRIVVMSSIAHSITPKLAGLKTIEELNIPWHGYKSTGFLAQMKRYSFTKLCNELFKVELQRRLDAEGSNIVTISTHPGMVKSKNSIDSAPLVFKLLITRFGKTLTGGATSALFAASSPQVRRELQKYKAAYLTSDATIKHASAQARDMKMAGDL